VARLAPLAFLLLAGSLGAQRTWVVDQSGGVGSDFRDIPAAVNAANDGDVILCRAGNYTGTTTSKGITLLGAPGATLNALIRRGMTVLSLPAGQTFAMKGFSANFSGLPGVSPLRVGNSLGRVHLEDLDFVADYRALDLTGTVTMSHVRVSGSYALWITNGDLSASRCTFVGTSTDALLLGSAGFVVDLAYCTATSIGSGNAVGGLASSVAISGDSSSSYTGPVSVSVLGGFFVDPAIQFSHGRPAGAMLRRIPALEAMGAAPGQSIATSLYSPAGELVVLVLSWPDYPFPVPPFGTMWIDPTSMFYFAVGIQDQTEHWQQQLPVPASAPRGLAIGLQGMSGPGLDIKFGNAVVVLLL